MAREVIEEERARPWVEKEYRAYAETFDKIYEMVTRVERKASPEDIEGIQGLRVMAYQELNEKIGHKEASQIKKNDKIYSKGRGVLPPPEKQSEGVDSILQEYIALQAQFLHAINQKIVYMSKDEAKSEAFAEQSIALKKKIEFFSEEAVKNPGIIKELEKIEASKEYSTADTENLEKLHTRLTNKSTLSTQERKAILKDLSSEARVFAWKRTQSKKATQSGGVKR